MSWNLYDVGDFLNRALLNAQVNHPNLGDFAAWILVYMLFLQ